MALYDHLGAHPEDRDGVAGTRFAVWAPNTPSITPGEKPWDCSRCWSVRTAGPRAPWRRVGLAAGAGLGAGVGVGFTLIGGATGMIGDPSFKATERSLNSAELIAEWVEKLGRQINRVLEADTQESAARIVNNADWMAGMDVLTFLRDVGKFFSVNSMIGKESVKQRINRPEQGISFTEFLGYQYLSNNRLLNFYGGIEFTQAYTKVRRNHQVDFEPDDVRFGTRKDFMFSVQVGWILPLYKRPPKEFYY